MELLNEEQKRMQKLAGIITEDNQGTGSNAGQGGGAKPTQATYGNNSIMSNKDYKLQLDGILSEPITLVGQFEEWSAASGGGVFVVSSSNQRNSDWGKGAEVILPIGFEKSPISKLDVRYSHGARNAFQNVTVKKLN